MRILIPYALDTLSAFMNSLSRELCLLTDCLLHFLADISSSCSPGSLFPPHINVGSVDLVIRNNDLTHFNPSSVFMHGATWNSSHY